TELLPRYSDQKQPFARSPSHAEVCPFFRSNYNSCTLRCRLGGNDRKRSSAFLRALQSARNRSLKHDATESYRFGGAFRGPALRAVRSTAWRRNTQQAGFTKALSHYAADLANRSRGFHGHNESF